MQEFFEFSSSDPQPTQNARVSSPWGVGLWPTPLLNRQKGVGHRPTPHGGEHPRCGRRPQSASRGGRPAISLASSTRSDSHFSPPALATKSRKSSPALESRPAS